MIFTDPLDQCYSTFFDSRHSFLAIKQFSGTPVYILPVNRRKVQKFAAPKGSAAPRLRTTDRALNQKSYYVLNQSKESNKTNKLKDYVHGNDDLTIDRMGRSKKVRIITFEFASVNIKGHSKNTS